MDTKTVTNDKGRNFKARILRPGDAYGLNNVLTWGAKSSPHMTPEENAKWNAKLGIEFYDMNVNKLFFPEGQFVSRYYLNTILTHNVGMGLDLQGDVPAWKIDAASMAEVRAWAAGQV